MLAHGHCHDVRQPKWDRCLVRIVPAPSNDRQWTESRRARVRHAGESGVTAGIVGAHPIRIRRGRKQTRVSVTYRVGQYLRNLREVRSVQRTFDFETGLVGGSVGPRQIDLEDGRCRRREIGWRVRDGLRARGEGQAGAANQTACEKRRPDRFDPGLHPRPAKQTRAQKSSQLSRASRSRTLP